MAYNFLSFDERAKAIYEWLQKEFSTVRTGRATPTLIDGIQVESYGAKVPINQIGSVGIEDARTLRVSVWDSSQIQQVEKAVIDADLGVSVAVDESGLRIIFPDLTGERRIQLLKLAKGKLEEARVSLRGARDDAVKKIESEEFGDDEKFSTKDELQKRVDTQNKLLDDFLFQKESEIQE